MKYNQNYFNSISLGQNLNLKLVHYITTYSCRNPNFELVTKTRVARLWAKRETWESHHMLPGVQRVWGNQPSHSQVNSHGGSWSPKWTLENSKSNFRSQNSMACEILYIIENLLERKCLKWARITHLDIWNTSYGQKEGRESNCQFDSWPQKVENRPDLLVYRGCATYRWKALNKSYNFV
jgi:hypothetical protein